MPSTTEYDPAYNLGFEDVCVDGRKAPTFVQVRIKASKTDPFRQGVTGYVGRTQNSLCPVTAVLSYMVARGSSPGALLRWEDGRFLTRESFVSAVRTALDFAGLRRTQLQDSSSHNSRLQDSLIKMLGRWESMAYTWYIRTPLSTVCKVAISESSQ